MVVMNRTCRWWMAPTLFAAGCSGGFNPIAVLKPDSSPTQVAQLQQQNAVQQNQQLQAKLDSLNANDEQLHKILAESQQQTKLAKVQNEALTEQLRSMAAQNQRLRSDGGQQRPKSDNLLASARRQSKSTSGANDGPGDDLPSIHVTGVNVRRDRELIRFDVSAARLFHGNEAQLTSEGGKLVEAVANLIDRRYPGRRIGVEGHTDAEPLRDGNFRGGNWANHHQLTLARANAVFNYLVRYTRLRTGQLSISGYGATQPFASNALPAGRERNRRIELTVYPGQMGDD